MVKKGGIRADFALVAVVMVAGLLLAPLGSCVSTRADVPEWCSKVRSDILGIAQAIEAYMIQNNGRFPQGLEVLVTPDEHGQTYLGRETIPVDPWGNEYIYELPSADSTRFRVLTYGADRVPGGLGDARDIDNRMIQRGEF